MSDLAKATTPLDLKSRFQALSQALNKGLYEREEAVNLALLSAIAGESIFLLGPPGVGKSFIARRLKYAFKSAQAFEYLMSRFSTPDEIFGPVSIQRLKDDRYERLTEGYLPNANVVFLDEIWKSGPAIQNALLTVLNEKIYKNGTEAFKVDIHALITASNELPPREENFAPLYDRFLVRYYLPPIQSKEAFLKLIQEEKADLEEDPVEDHLKIDQNSLNSWLSEIKAVHLSPAVLNIIQLIRYELSKKQADTPGFGQIYDRRWKKSVHLLKTSAFIHGRKTVELTDCFLLSHCLWQHPDQKEKIDQLISELVKKHGYNLAIDLQGIKNELEAIEKDIEQETQIRYPTTSKHLKIVEDTYLPLESNDKSAELDFIKVKEYNGMTTRDFEVINFYDQEKQLSKRLKAKKDGEYQIIVRYQDIEHRIPIETEEKTAYKSTYKSPHALLKRFWDKKLDELNEYVKAHLERFNTYKSNKIYADKHLFLSPKQQEAAYTNLRDLEKTLQQLTIRIEKAGYAYAK